MLGRRALELLGERRTLMAIRELGFSVHHFDHMSGPAPVTMHDVACCVSGS